MTRWLFIFSLLSGWALAEPVPVVVFTQDFHIGDSEEDFTIHIVRPWHTGNVGAGDKELKLAAAAVRAEAVREGYLNERTRASYERELLLLEEGRWPLVYITAKGSDRILIQLAYAIRWDDEPLPFEHRFFGQIPTFLDPVPSRHELVSGNLMPRFIRYPHLNMPPNFEYLQELLKKRPVVTGEKAEIKFLTGEDSNPVRFLPVIHLFSTDFELAKYSRRATTPEDFTRTQQWLERNHISVPEPPFPVFESYADYPTQRDERFSKYLHTGLFSPVRQHYVLNEKIFIHVSGIPSRHRARQTARGKFMRALGIPETPWMSFTETEKFGTEGVFTEIFEMSYAHFDLAMNEALKIRAKYDVARELAVEGPAQGGLSNLCPHWLSSFEAHLVQQIGD